MCACVSCRFCFWFLQWFRIVVVFLLGLHASAANDRLLRLSRGVGVIVIPFFVFSAHARRRQDKQYRTSSLAGAQGRPGQLLQAASISFTVEQLRLAGSKWTP